MKITCPACGFHRDVSPDRIPEGKVVATCPKCGEKFKINASVNKVQEAQEEEDIRLTASRAYQAEAERFKKEKNGETEEKTEIKSNNPWDLAPWPAGWAAAFFQTLYRVMFSAARFFASLSAQAGLWRALIFFIIIILFQTGAERIWSQFYISLLAPNVETDPELQKLLELFASDGNVFLHVLLRCGSMIFQLYLYTLIFYCAYRLIAPKKGSYELIFQIMAYSAAPLILSIIPILGSLVGMLWSIACFALGIKTALKLNWLNTLLGFLPMLFLILPLLSALLQMPT